MIMCVLANLLNLVENELLNTNTGDGEIRIHQLSNHAVTTSLRDGNQRPAPYRGAGARRGRSETLTPTEGLSRSIQSVN